jgi:hypothetical protein
MLDLIAVLAYLFFAFATAALIWAIREVTEKAGASRDWEPGTSPYSCRF